MKRYRGPQSGSRPPEFVAWDIEAVNWFDVTCVCVMHSSGDGFARPTIREAVEEGLCRGWVSELIPWYAHYGGGYDTMLAVRDLLPEWQLARGIYHSGFGIWCSDFARGNTTLSLRDSKRLLPGSLRSVGDLVGCPKHDVDREHIEALSWKEQVRYCMNDCDIIRRGLLMLWPYLEEYGDTLAARVTRHLRRIVPRDNWRFNADLDRELAAAYYGGRVEVFRHWQAPCAWYDINSSYPAAMALPLPTYLIGTSKHWHNQEGVIDATVTAPDCMYPPLPLKLDKGPYAKTLLFPTGTFRGMFAAPELRHAETQGVRIETVHKVWAYHCEPWMADFMTERFDRRAKAKAAIRAAEQRGDKAAVQAHEFDAYAQKIMLNSCAGKLIEREEHTNWTTIEPPDFEPESRKTVRLVDGRWISMYGVDSVDPGAFRHAVAAAYVTARGRVALHKGIVETNAAYCDTDCTPCAPNMHPSNVGLDRLGCFQYEKTYDAAQFVAPKVYATLKGEKLSVRAKGFFMPPDCNEWQLWQRIINGRKVERVKTASFVEQVNESWLAPWREIQYRTFSGGRPKRKPLQEGKTEPWHVSELTEA